MTTTTRGRTDPELTQISKLNTSTNAPRKLNSNRFVIVSGVPHAAGPPVAWASCCLCRDLPNVIAYYVYNSALTFMPLYLLEGTSVPPHANLATLANPEANPTAFASSTTSLASNSGSGFGSGFAPPLHPRLCLDPRLLSPQFGAMRHTPPKKSIVQPEPPISPNVYR